MNIKYPLIRDDMYTLYVFEFSDGVMEKTMWTLTSINKLLRSTKLLYELKQVRGVSQ